MVFEDIAGQDKVKRTLLDIAESGRIGHAYLFVGPEGIGRKSIAKRFAQLVMCMGETTNRGEVCGVCTSCKLHGSDTNPDYKIISEPEGKNAIGIDAIREIQESMTRAPLYGRRSFYVINNAEKMTVQAQNALLKTLEEPPEYVVLVLVCQNVSLLLETVKSRLSRMDFSRNTDEEIGEIFKRNGVESNDMIYSYADGIPGRALSLIDSDVEVLRKDIINSVVKVTSGGVAERKQAMKVIEGYQDKRDFVFYTFMSIYRDIMIMSRYSRNVKIQNAGYDKELYGLARKLGYHKAKECIEVVDATWKRIGRNVNFKLSCELMLVKLQEVIND
ncbi:MAG: ATP-binding protein [Clostridia bacterium]|jgi:DNA polymerase-3 subunit delta'|nr:DNA polymerase III subunit [Clostridia bacterium]